MVFTSIKFRSSARASNDYMLWQRRAVSCVALAVGVVVLQKSHIFSQDCSAVYGRVFLLAECKV